MDEKGDVTNLLKAIDRALPSATALRHSIHREPQLSGEEWPTAEAVLAALGNVDYEIVAGTGLIVRIGPESGPAVGIRAELDALPMIEQTRASFASQNGAMHACGHDVHVAGAVALAKAAMTTSIPVALVFIFQPREESYPSGARDIVMDGVLERHGVRSVIGAHVHPGIPVGSITTGSGVVNAAADEFAIVIEGLGGHAAYPHLTTDTIVAMAQVILSAQTIVSRRVDPMHPTVLTFGVLGSGTAANVIPARTTAAGSIRSSAATDRELIAHHLEAIVRNIAEANGCSGRLEMTRGEPILTNDSRLVERADPILTANGFDVQQPMRSCGSDDFSFYSEIYPSLMMFVGTGASRDGLSLHSPDFCPGDDSIALVARAFASGYLAAVNLIAAADAPLTVPN